MTTQAVKLLEIADDIESEFPEHSAFIRAMNLGGRPKGTIDEWLADVWFDMAREIEAGKLEEEAWANAAERDDVKAWLRNKKPMTRYLKMEDLWRFKNFNRVRKIIDLRSEAERAETFLPS